MTSKYRKALAIYGAIVACVLAVLLMLGNNLENRAARLDLKVMTLELKGNTSVIDRMGKLRNLTRAKAETLQIAAIFLVVALALFSFAIIIEDAIIWPIVTASYLASLSSTYFLWQFFLI
jgi:hypothetical protein